jgi:hypothetical protein
MYYVTEESYGISVPKSYNASLTATISLESRPR